MVRHDGRQARGHGTVRGRPPRAERARVHRLGNLRRGEARARGRVRPRPRPRRGRPGHAARLRPYLLRSQGRIRLPRLGRLSLRRPAAAHPAAGRHGGRRHRAPHDLRAVVEVPADRRRDRSGRRRRADGDARSAPEGAGRRGPVRRRPQAPAALSARGHRRRDLALGRGDPRHPAPPARAVSAPRAHLAGDRPGRALRPRGRRRHPRLQRHPTRRPGAAPRPHHRRARRRQPRGPLGVQRGNRRPCRRREPHPADLGGRPRDRHHAHRPRRRSPRPDADRRRRDGGAGAARPARRHRRPSSTAAATPSRACSSSAASGCATSPAGCRARRR